MLFICVLGIIVTIIIGKDQTIISTSVFNYLINEDSNEQSPSW